MAFKFRNILVLLLSVLAICTFCGCDDSSDGGEVDGDLVFYELENDVYGVGIAESAKQTAGKITIPSTYRGKPVTTIVEKGFSDCTALKEITIPTGVTEISAFAFSNCKKLEKIELGETVTKIGNYAFSSCQSLTVVKLPGSVVQMGTHVFSFCKSLNTVTLSDKLQALGDYTFYNCTALESISIPDRVESIGDRVFENCLALAKVEIGSGVTEINDFAFYACPSLEKISVDMENSAYVSYSGILYDKPVTQILVIPAKLSGSITIPEGVSEIEASMFAEFDKIVEVHLPRSLTYLGACAFLHCDALERVSLADPSNWKSDGAVLNSTMLSNEETLAKLLTGDYEYKRLEKNK